jgi:RNA polymerase sigma-70 factor (ECF subfamily)
MSTSTVTRGENLLTLAIGSPEQSLPAEDIVMNVFSVMRSPLYRHLMWMSLSPDQAEDVIQEAFLRFYQQLSSDKLPHYNLRGWVWRVAHNLALDMRNAANRKRHGGEIDLETVSDWLADPSPDPHQIAELKQSRQRVEAGIEQLNERDRQCVHLRVQGLGYRQIASILGIGRSTVADTLDRVTIFLRSCNHS